MTTEPENPPVSPAPPFHVAELHIPGIPGANILPWTIDHENQQLITYMPGDQATDVLTAANQANTDGEQPLAAMAITYGSTDNQLLTATVLWWGLLILDHTAGPADRNAPYFPVPWTPEEDPVEPIQAMRHLTGTLATLIGNQTQNPDGGITVPGGLVDPTGKPLA